MTKIELIKELAERACEGRLAFFVGAGFSKAVMGKYSSGPLKGRDRALSWMDLLREVAKSFGVESAVPCKKCTSPMDCPQIASDIVRRLHGKHTEWTLEDCEREIKDSVCRLVNWYPNREHMSEWPKYFEAIRPSIIITTNYDHVLETLLEGQAASFSSKDTLPITFDEKYLIYHMHGVRNRPDDIVLTREDYIEALRPFSYRQVRLTTLLRENSVLYIGYGKNDLNILSAFDVAQQTFSDIKDDRIQKIHVQVEYDVQQDGVVTESPSENDALPSYSIKVSDLKIFFKELSDACNAYSDSIRRDYAFVESLKSLTFTKDGDGHKKTFEQRKADIFNVFENGVKLLNTPTKLGHKIAAEFDDFIKDHYRALRDQSHRPGNWEAYADMWSLLYAYFSMFSPRYEPQASDKFNKPMPYTRRFGYALGWFNALAYWIGPEQSQSHQAWKSFVEDWPRLPESIREIIKSSAVRSGYLNILNLLERAKGKPKGELSDLNKVQLGFWKSFNEYCETRADFKAVFTKVRKPLPQHWMDLPCGSSAYHIGLTINSREGFISAELNIHSDKELYRALEASKTKIESECGCSFNWMELPDRKASRIVVSIPKNWQSAAEQKSCFDWLCNMALKIRKVFVKYV